MAQWNEKLRRIASHFAEFEVAAQCCVWYSVVHVFGRPQTLSGPVCTQLATQTTTLDRPPDIDRALELILPISRSEHQLHLVWSKRGDPHVKDALERFKGLLIELHQIVCDIPKGVLARPTVCSWPDADEERLLRWGLSLIQMTDWDQRVLKHKLHYALSNQAFQENGQVSPWKSFASLDRFKPIPFVSRVSAEDWSYWKQRHEEDNRKFPEVLAVSLTRNLFFATLYAVEQLGNVTSDQSQPIIRAPRRAKFGRRQLSEIEQGFLALLKEYHETHKPAKALTQKQMQQLTGAQNQTFVCRAMQKILHNVPVGDARSAGKRYQYLCEEGMITGVLKHVMRSTEPPVKEKPKGDLRHLSSGSDKKENDDGND